MTEPEVPQVRSKSWRQARMMARAAGDAEYAAQRGVPQETAQEFHDADLEAGIFFQNGELIPDPDLAVKEE